MHHLEEVLDDAEVVGDAADLLVAARGAQQHFAARHRELLVRLAPPLPAVENNA